MIFDTHHTNGGVMLRQLRLGIAVATMALGADPQSILAQPSSSRPPAGQRVRVNLAGDSGSAVGRVLGWDADTLMLEGAAFKGRVLPTPMRIPRASIVSYQQPVGRDYDRGFVRGARTGALAGAAVGLVLLFTMVMMNDDEPCTEFCIPPAAVGAVLGVGATLGGVLLGATFGTIAAPEVWGDPQSVASSGGGRSRSRQLALRFTLAPRVAR